jgi:hypothetical protein
MEKLELKHLAPYLPYALMLQEKARPRFQNGDYIFSVEKWVGRDIARPFVKRHGVVWCKPILRPLSDLNKTIEINGTKFHPKGQIRVLTSYKFADFELKDMQYGIIQLLFQWHFDVFGLIEKGLAIDINTL